MHRGSIQYTRDALTALQDSVKLFVGIEPWRRTIADLNLLRRPTRRGTKAGAKFRRPIAVLNSSGITHLKSSNNIDILALTETWLNETETTVIANLVPVGYTFQHVPRPAGIGGGVGLLFKSGLTVKTRTSTKDKLFTHFEHMDCNINSLLDIHGLRQHVVGPTHRSGYTLDVVITQDDSEILYVPPSVTKACFGDDSDVTCDHDTISFTINVPKPQNVRKTVSYRKLGEINVPSFIGFIADIKDCEDLKNLNRTVDELVAAYNSNLSKLLELHAPKYTKIITLRPHAPWYTDELRDAKHKRRKAERIWRRTGLTVDLQIFKDTGRNVNKLLIQEKLLFYSNKITECGGDQEKFFKLTKHLMGMSADTILPTHSSVEHLANRFGDFFADKVEGIVAEMGKSDVVADAMSSDCLFTGDVLASFDPTTEDEVRTLITSSPSKSCNLDPIPTWLLKECVGELCQLLHLSSTNLF
ncbi:hypothetical protein HOLleu_43846 [Holothuria leucospilota]|uniref:Uncharacterized protein n=1 Tax=Holothuria leucospilota TaxID=206669 RepID=A0A9Q1BAT8_HOLLE|nr:hypothetical protein HOLleu_43846 [Holothuria leucospilota]